MRIILRACAQGGTDGRDQFFKRLLYRNGVSGKTGAHGILLLQLRLQQQHDIALHILVQLDRTLHQLAEVQREFLHGDVILPLRVIDVFLHDNSGCTEQRIVQLALQVPLTRAGLFGKFEGF